MLVGVPRFELGTSRTRTVRSTGLSHTPYSVRIIPPTFVFASKALLLWRERTKHEGHYEHEGFLPLRLKTFVSFVFKKTLWIQQHFLAVQIIQAIDPVVVLADG